MSTSTILSDNGVSSGTSGIKTSGGNDGTLVLQTTTAGGAATTALTIDTSQNTTLAGTLTHPLGSAGSPSITFTGDTNTGIYSPTADTVAVATGGSERMRITSAGNVGIGTSSPSNYGGYTGITINNATTGGFIDLMANGVVVSELYGKATETALSAVASAPLILKTTDTERMRINAGAPILCLSGGNTSATGTGIAFPATQSASTDANTLDDYEEGTWTPTVRGESSAGTTTYTTQLGYYTKIGNIVHLFCSVAYSAATGTGALQIKGVPFNNVDRVTMGAVRVQDLDWSGTPTYLVAAFQDASGTIILNGCSDNAGVTENTLSNESAGIILQITYRV